MEEAQAGFELRVAERVTTLERRCEAGEEAVHAAVERCGERLLSQTKLLAAELHERSAAEQCEKLAAMATRFELAQTLLGDGDHEGAIEHLLLILRRDKTWNGNAHRELLIKIFDSLGSESEAVKKGRRKMSNYILM